MSRFPSRGSRDLWLSLEAFPRGFPIVLSHVPPWCESILGLKVEAVLGKQVSLECTVTSGTSKGSFTPLLQLKKFPDIPVYTREEERESRPHPEEPRFRLLAPEVGSFRCMVGKEFPAFPSHLKRRRSPQERRE